MPPDDANSVTASGHGTDPAVLHRPSPRPPRRVARHVRPSILVAISIGGSLGALARYAVSRLIVSGTGSVPWSTVVINLSGSAVLGLLLTLILERWPPRRYVRPFAAIGFLGAYTTFSTYVVETDLLVKRGAALAALEYLSVSLVGGLAAVYLGIVAGRLLATGRSRSW